MGDYRQKSGERMANFLDNGGKVDYTAPHIGAVAQLGERCVRNAEVRGSIPLSSTNKKATHSGWFFYWWKVWAVESPLGSWPSSQAIATENEDRTPLGGREATKCASAISQSPEAVVFMTKASESHP